MVFCTWYTLPVYPSPLVSVRDRKAVYNGVGQSVLTVLTDVSCPCRLPHIDAMVVFMENMNIFVSLPRSSHSQVHVDVLFLHCLRLNTQ